MGPRFDRLVCVRELNRAEVTSKGKLELSRFSLARHVTGPVIPTLFPFLFFLLLVAEIFPGEAVLCDLVLAWNRMSVKGRKCRL